MSTLKVNKLRDTAGSADAITLDPNGGAVLAGVTTVSAIKVGSGVTISSDGDVFHTGVCTATSFSGSGANLTGLIAGITEFDQWLLTANITSNGDLTSNLSRNTLTGNAYPIGTGMSESSGIFSFPSTGKYLVIVNALFTLNGYDNIMVYMHVTLNNGGAYTQVARAMDGNNGTGARSGSGTSFYLLDVTDTSNVKVKFEASSIGTDSSVTGSTTLADTSFTFIRIGDT